MTPAANRRADFPGLDPALRVAFEVPPDRACGATLTAVPLADVPDRLRPALEAPAPELSGARLLE